MKNKEEFDKINMHVDIAKIESLKEQEKNTRKKKGGKQEQDFESERSDGEPDANEGNYLDAV